MIGNKPKFNETVQWAYDYVELSWDAVNFIDTYTYKVNGTYSATGTYTGGVIVGYIYTKYGDVDRSVYVNSYAKRA